MRVFVATYKFSEYICSVQAGVYTESIEWTQVIINLIEAIMITYIYNYNYIFYIQLQYANIYLYICVYV